MDDQIMEDLKTDFADVEDIESYFKDEDTDVRIDELLPQRSPVHQVCGDSFEDGKMDLESFLGYCQYAAMEFEEGDIDAIDDSALTGLPEKTEEQVAELFPIIAEKGWTNNTPKANRRKEKLIPLEDIACHQHSAKLRKTRESKKPKKQYLYSMNPKDANTPAEARRRAKAALARKFHEGRKHKLHRLEEENFELKEHDADMKRKFADMEKRYAEKEEENEKLKLVIEMLKQKTGNNV